VQKLKLSKTNFYFKTKYLDTLTGKVFIIGDFHQKLMDCRFGIKIVGKIRNAV